MAESVLQLRVKELIAHHGSIRAAARVLMVDHTYLYRLSIGEKDDPRDDLLRRMKLRRVVTYERTDLLQPGEVQFIDPDGKSFVMPAGCTIPASSGGQEGGT